jgi:sporulation protein YlmC with PRC-barrel domain
MSFHPNQIQKEHVLKGIERIDNEKPSLNPSTRWDVIVNGRPYPPKEVMRFARQQYDGSDLWEYGGGPPTNKYLERMGFEIIDKTEYNRAMTENSNPRYWLYSPGENAEFWEEFYEKELMGLGWDYLGDLNQYSSKKEIELKLKEYEDVTSSKRNDATANFEFKEVIAIGDIVIVKKGRSKLLGYGEVISDYYYDEERKTFQKCRKVDWKKKGIWETGFTLALKTLTDITNYPENGSQYSQYYEKLLGIINGDTLPGIPLEMQPLNQILYGPPGTGKTYKLQHEYFEKYTVRETSLSRKQYLENLISELTWWQVITVAMIDLKNAKINDLYEHELIKIKEGLSKSESIKQTLWGQLQTHTKMECENVRYKGRSEPMYFWKDKNTNWTVDEELVEEVYPEAFTILEKSKSYTANPDKKIKNYEFVTFHQSFSYEDFVEGIKPKLEEQDSDLSYEIKDGIFKKLCLRATADPENQYALFIDEINRGNVSSIFGELITLIEDDKRLGQPNALTLKLPYSKREFGVPENLHVIGTMNTADRSVEALDTALRRRFIFEEIMPLPYLLREKTFVGFNLEEVLQTINARIEALLDRDHTIGHSYFIKIDSNDRAALLEAFENRIIPLLQEYFYHDYEKIALILGEGFIERKEGNVKFANFSQIDEPETLPSFELKKEITNIEAAIKKLLNHKDEEAA